MVQCQPLPPLRATRFEFEMVGDNAMNKTMKTLCAAAALAALSSVALAKLPAPSDEAKAKAAEAAAKTAWAGKVDAFKLCKSQDQVVAHYKKAPVVKDTKAPAKGTSAPAAAPGACVDPGPFVYAPVAAVPAGAASSAAPAATATPTAVASAPAAAKKP